MMNEEIKKNISNENFCQIKNSNKKEDKIRYEKYQICLIKIKRMMIKIKLKYLNSAR